MGETVRDCKTCANDPCDIMMEFDCFSTKNLEYWKPFPPKDLNYSGSSVNVEEKEKKDGHR